MQLRIICIDIHYVCVITDGFVAQLIDRAQYVLHTSLDPQSSVE